MEKIISGRRRELTDAIKSHVLSGLDRLESEYEKLTSARVVVDRQKLEHHVEVILHGSHIEIEANGRDENLWCAIDQAVDRAERQLRRELDKRNNHHHKSLAEIDLELAARDELAEAVNE
ncbi:MAG TPA: ribosome-associated translation inhibitor RaiA [Lentisphaeria bacterium]|nr:ribosome-associated translation inhibitor RaiA [Lentisphaeria bacterium]